MRCRKIVIELLVESDDPAARLALTVGNALKVAENALYESGAESVKILAVSLVPVDGACLDGDA